MTPEENQAREARLVAMKRIREVQAEFKAFMALAPRAQITELVAVWHLGKTKHLDGLDGTDVMHKVRFLGGLAESTTVDLPDHQRRFLKRSSEIMSALADHIYGKDLPPQVCEPAPEGGKS